ncbi:MAG: hypothetical protein D4R44_02755 [Actinobacteria bacterium]|nr:MAG: hypothetical protein D4R44_02755 [Actinomycetota bacterium]
MNQGMLSVLSRTRSGVNGSAGSAPDALKKVARSPRKQRVPEMAIGIALVIGGALGSLLLFQSATNTVTVVSSSRSLTRGHVISSSDLVAMELSEQSAKTFVKAADARSLVGKSLAVDIGPSTPIHLAMLRLRDPLASGEALTSTAVAVGDFPPELADGDKVQVVFAPDMSSGGAVPPALYGQVVTVWSIVQPDNSLSAAVITLRGPVDLALAIAGAGKVHIALLGDGSSDVRP